MGEHSRWGRRAPRDPADALPRARRHPVALGLGLLLVAAIAGLTAFAAWSLYADLTWRSSAQASADQVASAVQEYSVRDDSPPAPLDAVASEPHADQVAIEALPYAEDIPGDVIRFLISDGGALSVLTDAGALCAGVTLDMTAPGKPSSGSFSCGDVRPPPAPATLSTTPRDQSVILEWPHPPAPVADYVVSFSANGGDTWTVYEDGVSARSRATVRPLINGREYLFRVTAANLAGESAPVTAAAAPFTEPGSPTGVRATGGFRAVVTWTAPADDGGRPITGYLVSGQPSGSCQVAASVTRCEIADLPAAPGYAFTVRAINEAGAGAPSSPETEPVAVYSVPGRAVAVSASPGDRIVVLTWTPPLQDGNTPITDYLVEYRVVGEESWTPFRRPASPDTTATVTGLVNGTEYEFRVLTVNAVGTADPPLSTAVASPATIPGVVPQLDATEGNASVALAWSPPSTDGASAITEYAVQYRRPDGSWLTFRQPASEGLAREFADLVNGTRYAFRVAAVNRMGQGPWLASVPATPLGPPGAVVDPTSVGSLKAIELSWLPPANDGGRPVRSYLVDYRLTSAEDWIRVARIPRDETTVTVGDLTGGESYDVRIVAVTRAGVGPAAPGGPTTEAPVATPPAPTAEGPDERPPSLPPLEPADDRPTLAKVIADETPPAPEGLVAVPGDRKVTLSWQASPAGKKSPITAYTVTGTPAGTCTTTRLTCVVTGLVNGQAQSFTVKAANENIVGPESAPVSATPMIYNAATGGTVTTYTRAGRTYRVHTFTAGSTFTITAADQPFSVLVVGGGGGSLLSPDGSVAAGSGGGIINARRLLLRPGALNVAVGAGGPPGSPGGVSALDSVGSAVGGVGGSPSVTEFSPTAASAISGRPRAYGGSGSPTSGQGADGRGVGGGGPAASRGGNGIVIVRYEVAAQP